VAAIIVVVVLAGGLGYYYSLPRPFVGKVSVKLTTVTNESYEFEFKAPDAIGSVTWSIDGRQFDGRNADYTFTSLGTYHVSVTATSGWQSDSRDVTITTSTGSMSFGNLFEFGRKSNSTIVVYVAATQVSVIYPPCAQYVIEYHVRVPVLGAKIEALTVQNLTIVIKPSPSREIRVPLAIEANMTFKAEGNVYYVGRIVLDTCKDLHSLDARLCADFKAELDIAYVVTLNDGRNLPIVEQSDEFKLFEIGLCAKVDAAELSRWTPLPELEIPHEATLHHAPEAEPNPEDPLPKRCDPLCPEPVEKPELGLPPIEEPIFLFMSAQDGGSYQVVTLPLWGYATFRIELAGAFSIELHNSPTSSRLIFYSSLGP